MIRPTAPPPPSAMPPAPPIPRRSEIWPGSSREPGLNVMRKPLTGVETSIVCAPAYRPGPLIVIRPCHFCDGWQVSRARVETYRVVIANGPPDTETFDRRRVDPSAGCRAAAEPAICLDGGPSTMDSGNGRRSLPSGGGRFPFRLALPRQLGRLPP